MTKIRISRDLVIFVIAPPITINHGTPSADLPDHGGGDLGAFGFSAQVAGEGLAFVSSSVCVVRRQDGQLAPWFDVG